MLSLAKISSLDMTLHDGHLLFGPTVADISPSPAVRTCEDARSYLRDETATTEPHELYWMYRDSAKQADKDLFRKHGIRYDVTVIRPGVVGEELIKTVGHYHPVKPGTGVTYPEVYEVLHGHAIYLLQRRGPNDDEINDLVAISAGPGDKVLVPPGYGHVTINPGNDYLVMTNLVAEEFASVYEPYRTRRGAAYYLILGSHGQGWEKNPNYGCVPDVRHGLAEESAKHGLRRHVPLYQAFIDEPDRFSYLLHPEQLI